MCVHSGCDADDIVGLIEIVNINKMQFKRELETNEILVRFCDFFHQQKVISMDSYIIDEKRDYHNRIPPHSIRIKSELLSMQPFERRSTCPEYLSAHWMPLAKAHKTAHSVRRASFTFWVIIAQGISIKVMNIKCQVCSTVGYECIFAMCR